MTTETFEALVDRHRPELLRHSYRMLGSAQDAEDALQEALLAAWRGFDGFEGRSSVRTWLFRITTHACLRLASRRPRRLLSPDHGPACTDPTRLGAPVPGPVWLEPWVDEPPAPPTEEPAARYDRRESVELAFVAALQHLLATQRAVLILRDVLAFSAAEVAELLDTSVPAVNSALQRGRTTLRDRRPERSQQAELAALGPDRTARLVAAFVAAWERSDVPALVGLLTEDVRFTMPPLPAWFDGADAVAGFLARMFATRWQLRPVGPDGRLSGQPAFVGYQEADGVFSVGAVTVLSVRGDKISWIAGFVDPAVNARLVSLLGFPRDLPPDR